MPLNAVRRLFSREAEKRMESRITRFNRRVNYLIAQTDEVYHIIALHLGLSDSEMMVLYVLTDTGGECPLPCLLQQTGLSKQTVNSALRKLEADGSICLRMADRKSKIVCLTESGKIYAARTAGRLLAAENEIYGAWPKEELEAYLRLTEKYLKELREKAKQLGKDAL